MAARWTQISRLEPGDEPKPSYCTDTCFAAVPGFDDRQVLEKLRSWRVILRTDISELANTTVWDLQSSPSNISIIIDLGRIQEKDRKKLRKLNGHMQRLLDFDSFVKDFEEDNAYSYMISCTKISLMKRIAEATWGSRPPR